MVSFSFHKISSISLPSASSYLETICSKGHTLISWVYVVRYSTKSFSKVANKLQEASLCILQHLVPSSILENQSVSPFWWPDIWTQFPILAPALGSTESLKIQNWTSGVQDPSIFSIFLLVFAHMFRSFIGEVINIFVFLKIFPLGTNWFCKASFTFGEINQLFPLSCTCQTSGT